MLRTIGAQSRQLEYNVLGELASVCEITGLSGAGNCGQSNDAGNGYLTKYNYDGAGNLIEVQQNDQSSPVQTRNFTYDDLGRLTMESNPESGTTNYYYDTLPSGSPCTSYSSPGNLVETTDNNGNVVCYQYDTMNRVISIAYPNSSTPTKTFVYDGATVDGQAMANAAGQLAEVYTGPVSAKITDEGFSYDADGELTTFYESTPNSSGYYVVQAGYHANGVLATLTGTGFSTGFGFGLEGEGRPCSVVTGNPPPSNPACAPASNVLAENAGYNLGLAQGVTFGSGDSDSFGYDANTGQMTNYTFNVNGQSDSGTLAWNTDGTLGSLDISDGITGSQDTENCSYGYDDLLRLTSANCGASNQETYSYDAFGNLYVNAQGNNLTGPGSYNASNMITNWDSIAYNSDGDVTSDTNDSFNWDAANQMTSANDGTTYTLVRDGLGRVVEMQTSGGDTEIEYSVTGSKLALMNGQSLLKGFIPLPAGGRAVYNASGLEYYQHSDWIGSARLASTPSRGIAYDIAYAAFGEPYAGSGSMSEFRFAGHNADMLTQGSEPIYDAWYREYSYVQRRWLQPDPFGLAAVNPANPQSWNRYAYVGNNPLINYDSLGLYWYNCGTAKVTSPGMTPSISPGLCWAPDPTNNDIIPQIYNGSMGSSKSNIKVPNNISKCTAAQQYATTLASGFESASKTSGWLAFGAVLGTAISGAGEGFTFGGDTPVTVSFGAATDFFGTVSLTTGTIVSGLNSFAAGNTNALSNFDWNHLAGIAATAAASRIPGLASWAETIGHLVEQGADLANRAGVVCH